MFIELALGWNLYVAIVALLAITAVYTVAGKVYILMVKVRRPFTTDDESNFGMHERTSIVAM